MKKEKTYKTKAFLTVKIGLVLLLAAALTLALSACGKSGGPDTTAPDQTEAASAAPQTDEGTQEAADDPTDDPENDAEAVAALQEKLVGEWGCPGEGKETDFESLSFNAEGTGTYKSLPSDKSLSFTYEISIDHRTYNNGEAYTENMLHMAYDSGETEDIIFFFNENGKLAFHDSENGGYNGVMDALDVFTKY